MEQDTYSAICLQEGYVLRDHYKILNVLGRGGFSFTYKAEDTKFDRLVVIKEYFPVPFAVRSGFTVNPIDTNAKESYADGLQSFFKEAQILAKFRNEHICSVLDYFQENGTAYLVMPYLVGEPLSMVLRKCPNNVMSCDAVRKWLVPLLYALREIHAASYMHRDIKPSNIYITFEGTPILIDFGAARAFIGRTHGYTVVLTPEYAPPEQSTTDIAAQGAWTDIYALGAVAYCCLMGTPPPDAQKRVLAKANGEPDPLDKRLSDLYAVADAELYAFIEKALVLSYAKRIQSVSEALKILHCSDAEPKDSAQKKSPQAATKTNDESRHEEKKNKDVLLKNNKIYKIFFLIFCVIFFGIIDYLLFSPSGYINKHRLGLDENIIIPLEKESAYENDAEAQFNLGMCFETGKGVKQDYDQAVYWYKKAAEQNHAKAQYKLGWCFETGKGVKKDDDQAVHWYKKAAEQDYAEAQYVLALCYKYGKVVKQDYNQAVYWYKKAAEQNHAKAQNNLGDCFRDGKGVKKDYDQAVYWYRKAAVQNYVSAQLNLAMCYEFGEGVKKDYDQAEHWYKKAAEQDDARSQFYLGEFYVSIKKDYNQAVYWFKKAAVQNYADAQCSLGMCYHEGIGVKKDYDQAVYWYKKAAEQNDAIAQNNLGFLYDNGQGVSQNKHTAKELYGKACDNGLQESCDKYRKLKEAGY